MQLHFLNRILPTLPPPGPFGERPCYFSLSLKEKLREQNPCSSPTSICHNANMASAAGFDSYMALASFKSPLGGRKQQNAEAARCLWCDIDAGKPTSVYKDYAEALAGLVKFVNQTGLKPSIVVSSGMGLHVYYTFTMNVAAALWTQVADFFFQLCKQEGLDVDPARARDIASVLRLPGTIHQKTGNVVAVQLGAGPDYSPRDFLQRVTGQLRAPTPVAAPVHIATPRVQGPPSLMSQLLGMAPEPPTADAIKIAKNCSQIKTMGAGLYPQWFAAMSVLRRCHNGLKLAQALSACDESRYDAVATEKKFYDAAENMPSLCTTLEVTNPGGCIGCPHKGTIKTPVQLTNISTPPSPPAQPAPVIPAATPTTVLVGQQPQLSMPEQGKWNQPYVPIQSPQFTVDATGVVWHQSVQDANKQWSTVDHVITAVQLWFKYSAHRYENGNHTTLHYFDAIFPNQTIREIQIVAGEDMTEHNIMKLLYSADITPKGQAFTGKVFMGFFNAYLDSVMNIKKIVPIVKEFGWTRFDDPVLKRNVQGFVVGAGAITETGVHPVGVDPGTTGIYAEKAFAHAGTMDEWKFVPQMYKVLNQQMSIFALCGSLASPFMKYGIAEAKNSYVNLYSTKGGKGKSTLLRACHSIWGNPQHAFGSPAASISQRGKAMSVWNNLPYYVDEITRMNNEDMNHMVYTLAGGMDKDRLKSNADLTATGQWSMFTMSTANRSVKEALAKYSGDTDATLLRVTEYECDFASFDDQPLIQQYIRTVCDKMEANFGLAGPQFMFHVMQHPERLVTIRAAVDNWRIANGFKDNERFLAFSVGIPLHIGRWAVEWGIFDFDMDALEKWILDVLVPFNRDRTSDLAPDFVNNLTVYLNSRLPSTLQVLREKRNPGEVDGQRPGMYDKYIIRYPQYNELTARYEQENNVLHIAAADFKKWCDGVGISPNAMVKDLAFSGILLESTRVNLGGYVSWLPTSRMRCYTIRGDSLDKLGWRPSSVSAGPPAVQGGANVITGIDLDTLNAGVTVGRVPVLPPGWPVR